MKNFKAVDLLIITITICMCNIALMPFGVAQPVIASVILYIATRFLARLLSPEELNEAIRKGADKKAGAFEQTYYTYLLNHEDTAYRYAQLIITVPVMLLFLLIGFAV